MATTNTKSQCYSCQNKTRTFLCQGCQQNFCFDDLTKHNQEFNQNFEEIEINHDQLRQLINAQKQNSSEDSLFKRIDQWENESIDKIKQTAENCRDEINKYLIKIENKFDDLGKELEEIRQDNQFDEIHLDQMKTKLNKLNEEFEKLKNISIQKKSSTFIDQIFVRIKGDQKWKQHGVTIVGTNQQRIQISRPHGIFLDDHQNIFIADWGNDRIVEWELNSTNAQIIAGGKQNQLCRPTDVVIDKENNSLIIADQENRRVMRWSHENDTNEQILISDIDCRGLTMDKDGSLYVSDWKKNEVRRWKRGDEEGIIVAGGNGEGDGLNQLNWPSFIFVDEDYSLFLSDSNNHRVMKWIKDAKEGIIVAGGNGKGDQLTQLCYPRGVIVDQLGQIYVADCENHRVMRWCEGAKEGTIVVGGNEQVQESSQLNFPKGLSFDEEGNLYVADDGNDRIQKFEMI